MGSGMNARLQVTVQQGVLRGAETKNVGGGSYICFKGIPYAAPPIGELRFTDPQPPETWTGVRDALNEGPKCAQVDIITQNISGEEDCLYLNVATTSLKHSRPVMVWIHGGGFMMGDGSSDTYGPDYFMNSDVVLVTISYRLGVFGFLYLDHEAAPGNIGLKDQVAALQWVKENISQFGGDSNNITIFGESAGSISVHYLLHSPLAKGLFHKAIMQSGTLSNSWMQAPPSYDIVHRIVAALGKETTDPYEIVEYLRTIPVDKLLAVQEEVQTPEERLFMKFPFRPIVDDKSKKPFISRPLKDVATEGVDVPLMVGYTSDEGLLFLLGFNEASLSAYEKNFDMTMTFDLIEKAPSKIPEVGRIIKEFYFKDKPISTETLKEFVKCYGDVNLVMGIHKTVEIQQNKKTPTYFYRFSHTSPNSMSQVLFRSPLIGAGHGDELAYLFHSTSYAELNIKPGSTEETVSNRMVKMWTDFAKTGNPTPQIDDLITVKWDPVTRTTKNYLEIGDEISSGVNPDEEISQLSKRISEIVNS